RSEHAPSLVDATKVGVVVGDAIDLVELFVDLLALPPGVVLAPLLDMVLPPQVERIAQTENKEAPADEEGRSADFQPSPAAQRERHRGSVRRTIGWFHDTIISRGKASSMVCGTGGLVPLWVRIPILTLLVRIGILTHRI